MDDGPSRTALSAAVARGRHRYEHARPWVFDDPFALLLVGPSWHEAARVQQASLGEAVDQEAMAGVAIRSRYTEDRLEAGGHAQYVILGAGLDSFAWRRPDLGATLRIFEVDHPASQRFKAESAARLGLPEIASVVHVPIDFERETLEHGLERSGFAWQQRAFFSWLGVTMYLTVDASEATLSTVARCAPGSEVVFSYARSDEHLDDVGIAFHQAAEAYFTETREHLISRFSRAEAEALVERCGLRVADHPDRDDLVARYAAGREDGLKPYTVEGVIAAVVP